MELRKIDKNNVWKILKLKVREDQEDFVATNTESIIEAFVTVSAGDVALPFGLYENGEPVGFAMIGYSTIGDEDEPSVADGNYCLWRFMIDKNQQGKGLGKNAMAVVLDYIRTFPCGDAKFVWLSYEPENTVAKQLYESFGFRENGETDGDEIVAVLEL